jgi:hypothetical protein
MLSRGIEDQSEVASPQWIGAVRGRLDEGLLGRLPATLSGDDE